jgi:alpha-N-arabinofuranosidase
MFAALTADRKFLTIAVVNATESEKKFELNVTGARLAGPSTLWQMTGSGPDAANHLGQAPQVTVKEIPLDDASTTISVAPISVGIYRFAVAPPAP